MHSVKSLFLWGGIAILLTVVGCGKKEVHYDGGQLLRQKCAICHNLDMPPKTYEDEKAPPMMAVAFHVKDFMKVQNPTDKKPKFIAFFQDFVLHPAREKSFCDKESLDAYGLMPSLEGNVTKAEVGAIAEYVYDFYDQEKFMAKMKERAHFEALPKGEQIAVKKGCLTCHGKSEAKAAPSLKEIAHKDRKEIIDAIQNGSRGKWKGFERMTMPAFGNRVTTEEMERLVTWIKTL